MIALTFKQNTELRSTGGTEALHFGEENCGKVAVPPTQGGETRVRTERSALLVCDGNTSWVELTRRWA